MHEFLRIRLTQAGAIQKGRALTGAHFRFERINRSQASPLLRPLREDPMNDAQDCKTHDRYHKQFEMNGHSAYNVIDQSSYRDDDRQSKAIPGEIAKLLQSSLLP